MSCVFKFFVVSIFCSFYAQASQYKVSQSDIQWIGRELLSSSHNGKISLQEGQFVFVPEEKSIKSGRFVIDMSSIVVEDLKIQGLKMKLLRHLRSRDFFDVKRYPTAILLMKRSRHVKDNQYQIFATLIIRGKSVPINFMSTIEQKDNKISFQSNVMIDRTKWGITYRSKNFFKLAKDKLIRDHIELKVSFIAVPNNLSIKP